MKKLILSMTIGFFLLTATPAMAAKVAHVNVNGLVCDFCARALEKVFSKEAAVTSIDVDLDKKMVTVIFKDGQMIDDDRLKQLITDAGYSVGDIHRMEHDTDHHDMNHE